MVQPACLFYLVENDSIARQQSGAAVVNGRIEITKERVERE